MAMKQSRWGVVVLIGVLVAGAAGLGWTSFKSAQETQRLEAELAAFDEQRSSRPSYSFQSEDMYSQAAAERRKLSAAVNASSATTSDWNSALIAYLFVVMIGAVFVWLCLTVRQALDAFRASSAEREVAARLAGQRVGSAVRTVRRAMSSQPTLGGGRLSTADELRKWSELKDQGLVSEEEFTRMREKLLG